VAAMLLIERLRPQARSRVNPLGRAQAPWASALANRPRYTGDALSGSTERSQRMIRFQSTARVAAMLWQ
jgi:hypothetical protein